MTKQEINTLVLSEVQKSIEILLNVVQRNSEELIVSKDWIKRTTCMEFLGYKNTQMVALEKSGELIVSKIGKRKFILRESLNSLIEKGKIN